MLSTKVWTNNAWYYQLSLGPKWVILKGYISPWFSCDHKKNSWSHVGFNVLQSILAIKIIFSVYFGRLIRDLIKEEVKLLTYLSGMLSLWNKYTDMLNSGVNTVKACRNQWQTTKCWIIDVLWHFFLKNNKIVKFCFKRTIKSQSKVFMWMSVGDDFQDVLRGPCVHILHMNVITKLFL